MKILAISGSLRAASINSALRAILKTMSTDIVESASLSIPLLGALYGAVVLQQAGGEPTFPA